ncbi:hypothetical protein ACFLZH_00365 [Patescibacteria group bacterium]
MERLPTQSTQAEAPKRRSSGPGLMAQAFALLLIAAIAGGCKAHPMEKCHGKKDGKTRKALVDKYAGDCKNRVKRYRALNQSDVNDSARNVESRRFSEAAQACTTWEEEASSAEAGALAKKEVAIGSNDGKTEAGCSAAVTWAQEQAEDARSKKRELESSQL